MINNKDIKFRAKSLDGNYWVYGDYRHPIDNVEDYKHTITSHKNECDDKGFQYQIDPKTLGVFTGLYDSEGNEIWSGDILFMECFGYGGGNVVVEWNKEIGCWVVRMSGNLGSKPLGEWLREDKLKVIGNIYDNPEIKTE